jgi:hypothetical protein
VEIGEERLLENIGDENTSNSGDDWPEGGEESAPILPARGGRLEGLTLVHEGSRLPGPMPSHHASWPMMRRN